MEESITLKRSTYDEFKNNELEIKTARKETLQMAGVLGLFLWRLEEILKPTLHDVMPTFHQAMTNAGYTLNVSINGRRITIGKGKEIISVKGTHE